jgi:hypothetical protein
MFVCSRTSADRVTDPRRETQWKPTGRHKGIITSLIIAWSFFYSTASCNGNYVVRIADVHKAPFRRRAATSHDIRFRSAILYRYRSTTCLFKWQHSHSVRCRFRCRPCRKLSEQGLRQSNRTSRNDMWPSCAYGSGRARAARLSPATSSV